MTTTTVYGTWYTRVKDGTLTLEASVLTALGDFTADYDLEAINAEYKEAINAALPDGVSLQGDEFHGPALATDVTWGPDLEDEDGRLDIKTIVEGVDFWAIATKHDHATDVDAYTITVDDETAQWLTARAGLWRLGGDSDRTYGLTDLGDGRVKIPAGSLDALTSREEHEDGCVSQDDNGYTMWIRGLGYLLTPLTDD